MVAPGGFAGVALAMYTKKPDEKKPIVLSADLR